MLRHAYMILAHEQKDLLAKLIQKLDVVNNDIYIHLDRRSSIKPQSLANCVKNANLFFVDRINVEWGGYSIIKATMILLEQALKTHHIYYHLLSGTDLPLKDINKINKFFEDNQGKEFIRFFSASKSESEYNVRFGYKSYFRDKCGRTRNFWQVLNKLGLLYQKIFHIYDGSLKSKFLMGSQFWDITENFAREIFDNRLDFENKYKYASCSDEIFIQTFIQGTNYFENLWVPYVGEDTGMEANMRFIDFSDERRGSPHTIVKKDIEYLVSTNLNFARKFNLNNKDAIEELERLLDTQVKVKEL